MIVRERREIGPVLLKFGVALALSLGGIIFSVLRTKRIKPSRSLPPPPPPNSGLFKFYHPLSVKFDLGFEICLIIDYVHFYADCGNQADHHGLERTSLSSNSASGAPEKHVTIKATLSNSTYLF